MPEAITDKLDLWTSALLTKSTAGRGSNGKLEAYGIKKLRELILELAVRGKLVPQEPNDEPASELLKRTIAERKRLIKEDVIREAKEPALPDATPDYKLPASWVWTNLYTIGEIAPRNEEEDAVDSSFVPMQSISEKYGVPVQHEVKAWGEIKSGFTHFREEDVVLAKITPCFQNGKSAVMRGLTNGFGAGTTELHVYRTINACTVPEFVLVYLKSPRFISDGIPKMTGTAGQKRITRDYFAGNHFPLPPLAEQHRIVAKVEELMALCDQLEQQQTHSLEAHQTLVETLLGTLTRDESKQEFSAAWARIASHFDTLFTTEASIDQLKQTILQLAVMGKLVPQDPNDESASVLLKRITEAKERLVKKGLLKKQLPLTEVTDAEMPFEIPDKWEWSRLGNLGIGNTGKTPSTGNPEYYDGEIPFIGPGQITPAGEILDSDKYLTESGCEYSTVAEPGDVLMVCIGGSIGKSAITVSRVAFNQQINCIRPIFVSPVLLNFTMNTPHFQSAVLEKATGSATPIINRSKWEELLVPVPPEAEQHRIVAKVDELMAVCDALKARLADTQAIQLHLADAIVEQAVC